MEDIFNDEPEQEDKNEVYYNHEEYLENDMISDKEQCFIDGYINDVVNDFPEEEEL